MREAWSPTDCWYPGRPTLGGRIRALLRTRRADIGTSFDTLSVYGSARRNPEAPSSPSGHLHATGAFLNSTL